MTRAYTLPNTLLDNLEKLPLTRTQALREAVDLAYKRPVELVRSLQERVNAQAEDRGRTARVSVSFEDDTIAKLAVLTGYCHLPTEHVLRLAGEAIIRKYTSEKATE